MEPASAAVAFATVIAQVTVASVKLKRLWGQISDTPGDTQYLIQNLETVEILLNEMGILHSKSTWSEEQCLLRCQGLCTTAYKELEASARVLEAKLKTKGRVGKKLVAARAVLNRDVLANQEKRLERAMNLLFFAHQIACSRTMAHSVSVEVTRRLLVDVIPKLATPEQDPSSRPSIESGFDRIVTTNSSIQSANQPGVAGPSRRTGQTKHAGWVRRLRFPTWWSDAIYELRFVPQPSSYIFRIYNVISMDAPIVEYISEGDAEGVRVLFESRQASPYDVVDDWSLVKYATVSLNVEILG
ncbi:hypothetical protein NLU13_8255 [Sarocladium strictum]|nr:hypothetical protein NLU13_8255 [Sarocladium strictum]